MKARCCWPPESVATGSSACAVEPDAGDRLLDDVAIVRAQRSEQAAAATRPAETTSRTVAGASIPRWARCGR